MYKSVAVSVLLLAGCSLLIDPDKLSAGTAQQSDAEVDTGTEAGRISDGGNVIAEDATPGSPCNKPHLWCEDFEAAALDPSWTATQELGTSLKNAPAPGRPGTRALELRKIQAKKVALAFVERAVAAPRLRCEVDYFFETAPNISTFYNLISRNPEPQTFYQVSVSHEGSGLVSFGDYADPGPVRTNGSPIAKPLTTGRWIHLAHTYDPKRSVAEFDGTTSMFNPTFAPANGSSWVLRIGIPYEEAPSAEWALFIDNAFCDAL
jgi:hypothetical protein